MLRKIKNQNWTSNRTEKKTYFSTA